ncbi:MAG TPA: leucyl aminopeptidase [Acidimicrobiales bacterium]|nr:leucyl aminopeptidase [Acidimicrobiales bacterium]
MTLTTSTTATSTSSTSTSSTLRTLIQLDAAARPPADAELLGLGVHPGGKVARSVAGVDVDPRWLGLRGFDGKVGEVIALPTADAPAVVAVGLGPADRLDADGLRRAAAAFVRASGRARTVALALGGLPRQDPAAGAQAVAEGASLAAYRFSTYKDEDGARRRPDRLVLVGPKPRELAAGLNRGRVIASAVALARDLVNTPAADMTPGRLAAVAAEVAESAGLSVTVLDEHAIESERLGGLAGVARGSAEPARLIRLAYEPDGHQRTIALVGKGITFDSGGLSLKSADGMMTMKTDMSGAAAVLAAMAALRDLGVRTRVLGFVPATENMPGGRAIKPGDVLRARNGKTIEVLNTDAEGRLVLADGLSLAVEEGPDAIVDLATLTGAVVTALGRRIAGLMGNDDEFTGEVQAAAARAGEKVWVLPLPEEYRKDIDSEVADIKNIGAPGQAGTLIAGLFLKEFVGDVPWAHLDIAGTARSDADDGYITKGGTGFGVRTLIELLGD